MWSINKLRSIPIQKWTICIFFSLLSQLVYVRSNCQFSSPQMGNKIYRQIKLTHHFSLVKKPPFDLLSSRSKCKAVWILVDISQTFLYHLKITQCFLIFNLISWYYQTCVSLTSPCFSALLAELHRTFPEKREGILKYSVCTWDINVRTVPSANNQEAER